MRKLIAFLLIVLIVTPCIALAHPGGTDSEGGHTDHSTGEYHYHHGYPAHEHKDMDGDGKKDCPYDFKDATDHRTGSSNSNSSNKTTSKPSTTTTSTVKQTEEEESLGFWDIVLIVVAIVLALPEAIAICAMIIAPIWNFLSSLFSCVASLFEKKKKD